MTPYKWLFINHFRRQAFDWRSDTPITHLKDALREIKSVARHEPTLAADGAIAFLEKLSPALATVDSSSGAMVAAVSKAVDTLVPVIIKAEVTLAVRQHWLERLWQALQSDGMAYIESLGNYWGELCVFPELASSWADGLLPFLEHTWSLPSAEQGHYKGTTLCLSSLYGAKRYQELLVLLDKAPAKCWYQRYWGVKALVSLGRKAEAIRYAEDSRSIQGANYDQPIAQACETILLSSGLAEEAYQRYALVATPNTTGLAMFRSLVKRYPGKPKEHILRDLMATTPNNPGKWLAALKAAGLAELASQ